MGEILYRTRLSIDIFRGFAPWMRCLPGKLLETTNLPRYHAAIAADTGLPVTDILACIDACCPGAGAPQFS